MFEDIGLLISDNARFFGYAITLMFILIAILLIAISGLIQDIYFPIKVLVTKDMAKHIHQILRNAKSVRNSGKSQVIYYKIPTKYLTLLEADWEKEYKEEWQLYKEKKS